MTRGKFITFEGGEGSGKSTQARRLAERLEARGIDVTRTREPGGSPFAERLRTILLDPTTEPHSALSEALLFYAARADHLDKVIRPALTAGRWVVCDRFSDSTRVYQGYAGTLAPGTIDRLESLVVAPTIPDLTVIIDIPVRVGLARAAARRAAMKEVSARGDEAAPDNYENREAAFHERLRAGFLAIARREPERCAVVDGEGPEKGIEEVVWAAVETRLLSGVR